MIRCQEPSDGDHGVPEVRVGDSGLDEFFEDFVIRDLGGIGHVHSVP
jgi:hypothetical protein